MDAVLSVMVSDSIGPGTAAQELVKALGSYLGLRGGIALREYGRAIDLVFGALGLRPGDTVALSPLAPDVYVRALERHRLRPLYIDTEENWPLLTRTGVERAIAEFGKREPDQEVAAIIVDYALGFVPEAAEIGALGPPLIEDISHAVGANDGSKKAGTYGKFAIAAVEAEHIVTAGGGALVFAQSPTDIGKLRSEAEPLGASALLADLNAALGQTQVRELESFVRRRQEIAALFSRAVTRTKHRSISQRGDGENVFGSFPVLLETGRKEVAAYARKNGVEIEGGFEASAMGLLVGRAEQDAAVRPSDYPNAYAMYLRCVRFPLYPSLTREDCNRIERVLLTIP
jgi:dTDP-4-amino-4,6-dideoxygalactose transaminase